MAGDDVKRKRTRTTHRRHAEQRSSKSHTASNDEATTTDPTAANDRSPNINALRKARLAHLNDSPQDIPEDMKYVYEKRIKTAAHVSADAGSRHRPVTDRTSEQKESRSSRKSTRRTEDGKRDDYHDETEDDYEYVYSTPVAEPSRRDTHEKSSTTRRRRRSSPSHPGTTKTKKAESRREPERRHTEPTRGKTVRGRDEEECVVSIPPRMLSLTPSTAQAHLFHLLRRLVQTRIVAMYSQASTKDPRSREMLQ